MGNCFIVDIGKTNIKCQLLDTNGKTLWCNNRANQSLITPYLCFDIETIWQWLIDQLRIANQVECIDIINISTHGACAALLDKQGKLVLPVMDYEHCIPDAVSQTYDRIRPSFEQTFSPNLPLGLNLGRQLYWQQQVFAEEYAKVDSVLMYPQYWVWRLTGIKLSEISSFGCHTDLWSPRENQFSPLVEKLGLRNALPEFKSASEVAGQPTEVIRAQTGLKSSCRIFSGVHDSNAGFARYLYSLPESNVTLISTGTWVVCMTASNDLDHLNEHRDMLANVSVTGTRLSCARFMGGREFEKICSLTDATVGQEIDISDFEKIIEDDVFALPAFSDTGGPFYAQHGYITGTPVNGKALATLYLALMIDYELELLGVNGDLVLGSSASKNPLLCKLLAQLRPRQQVLLSGDTATTVMGAWCLTRWNLPPPPNLRQFQVAQALQLSGLAAYRLAWRRQTGAHCGRATCASVERMLPE